MNDLVAAYGADQSAPVIYLAYHTLASDYVNAIDKTSWRNKLINTLKDIDDSDYYPVMSLGAAVWALAQTGNGLDTTTIPSGSPSFPLRGKKLNELPGILASEIVPSGTAQHTFYDSFGHVGAGYTEDTAMGLMGLQAAYAANPSLAYSTQIFDGQTDVSSAVANDGSTYLDIYQSAPSDNEYSGRLLESLIPEPFNAWNVNADGSWKTLNAAGSINWKGVIPNFVGAGAFFGNVISSPHTVTVGAPIIVGNITFSSNASYTIAGTSSLTMSTASPSAVISVLQGSHTISAPLTLLKNTLITIAPSASTLTISSDITAGANTITKDGLGKVRVTNVRAGGLTVTQGTAQIIATGNGDTHNNSGTSKVGTLTVAASGATLDISNNLFVAGGGATPLATMNTIRDRIISGRNVPVGGVGDGTWDGQGITSSSAHARFVADGVETRAIGYALNSTLPLGAYSTFGGQSAGPNDILIRYTRNADATLDGTVSDDDVTVLGALYDNGATTGHNWDEGDFNFDGKLDDADVTLLGAFYDQTAAPISPASLTAKFGSEFAAAFEAGQAMAVPEPATLVGFATFVFASGLRRNRRKQLSR